MKVRVRLFAAAKDLAGRDVLPLEVAKGATIANVREAILAAVPSLAKIIPHSLWAVDTNYATDVTPITEVSEIALIPPVSGG